MRPALGAGWVQPWGPQLVLWSPALKRSEAIRLIYIWELKWNVSGLPLRLLCLVFMETCVYGETLSMLATDRCFCSLSVIMLRMFLLGEELPFFFSSYTNTKDRKKLSTLLKSRDPSGSR